MPMRCLIETKRGKYRAVQSPAQRDVFHRRGNEWRRCRFSSGWRLVETPAVIRVEDRYFPVELAKADAPSPDARSWCIQYAGSGHYFPTKEAALGYAAGRGWLARPQLHRGRPKGYTYKATYEARENGGRRLYLHELNGGTWMVSRTSGWYAFPSEEEARSFIDGLQCLDSYGLTRG